MILAILVWRIKKSLAVEHSLFNVVFFTVALGQNIRLNFGNFYSFRYKAAVCVVLKWCSEGQQPGFGVQYEIHVTINTDAGDKLRPAFMLCRIIITYEQFRFWTRLMSLS